MDKNKLTEQYRALDRTHTQYVREQNWVKVADTFKLMMQVSDQMYGKGRDA